MAVLRVPKSAAGGAAPPRCLASLAAVLIFPQLNASPLCLPTPLQRLVHFDLKSANLLLGYRDRRPVCKVRMEGDVDGPDPKGSCIRSMLGRALSCRRPPYAGG